MPFRVIRGSPIECRGTVQPFEDWAVRLRGSLRAGPQTEILTNHVEHPPGKSARRIEQRAERSELYAAAEPP